MTTSRSAPIIVLCSARSGSTLLRYVLDVHPAVATFGETALARTCRALLDSRAALGLGAAVDGAQFADAALGAHAAALHEAARASTAASTWCDKSLDNARHCAALATVFPDARFVALVRHPLDMVASGLEATPWGYSSFGFIEYVRRSPGNVVDALLNYWCDCYEPVLRLVEQGDAHTTVLRYEDFVADPTGTGRALLEFAGLDATCFDPDEAFTTEHTIGIGDFKALFTDRFETGSIGRGRRIPVAVIDTDLRSRVDKLATAFGYDPIGDDFNFAHFRPPPAEIPSEVLARLHALDGPAPEPPDGPVVLLRLVDLGASVVVSADGRRWWPESAGRKSSTIVATDLASLDDITTGRLNFGAALRTGAARCRGSMATAVRALSAIDVGPGRAR